MKALPENVKPYKQTPVFTEKNIPKGLLQTLRTKEGTWGKICISKGKLLYVIESEVQETKELSTSIYGVVEPQVPHHVTPIGEVEFFVEFLK